MLRQNTRAPFPRRLRDRLRALDRRSRKLAFQLVFTPYLSNAVVQEKRPIKIKDLATLKRFVAVIGRPVPCTARLASRRTNRQTDRQTKYRNPRCACAPRVNNHTSLGYCVIQTRLIDKNKHVFFIDRNIRHKLGTQ